ncbi:MAG: D-tyrosyl-tRNA(Tyr) deacylase [Oscillospiraceae bacterium]|jgi:D-tyrosyl-tRNA(Tyr) deacylase|nr:D-tyrosyl-tRNA(Tyr) deacylase [Oscillospiraceae bacterium]
MKAVLQRVSYARSVTEGKISGETGEGLLIFLGVFEGDGGEEAGFLAQKCAELRIFSDKNDKMNLSLLDTGGGALVVSNFTLCANARKGRRPSFTASAPPERANALYEYFISKLKEAGVKRVESGIFGADMKIELSNSGPVTIILDTREIMPGKV